MNDTATGNYLVTTGPDPYARAAARATSNGIFLRFTKLGNWVAGQDNKRIPTGTRVTANMAGLRYGWRGWFGGPPEDLTELVSESRPTQRRADLGDNDEKQWDKNDDGSPKDPWQLTYILEMADNDGQLYIFAPSSFGGRRSVERLCGAYAEGRRMRPDMIPVIALNSGTFTSRKWGETAEPLLDIVDWVEGAAAGDPGSYEPDTGELPYDGTPVSGGGVSEAEFAKPPTAGTRATRF